MSMLHFRNVPHLFRHALCEPFFVSTCKFPQIHFPRGKLLFQIQREFLPKRSLEIVKVVHNQGASLSLVLASNDRKFLSDKIKTDFFIKDLFMKILTVAVSLQRCFKGNIEITQTTRSEEH